MKTFIVADAGSNHCGSLAYGELLIEEAKEAGADAIKFQATSRRSWKTEADWARRAPFAVEKAFLVNMALYAEQVGIEFMCTPFDPEQVAWLDPFVKRWKVASPNARDHELLAEIAMTGKPVIVSAGYLKVNEWQERMRAGYTVLFCVPKYPARVEEYRLQAWTICVTGQYWSWGLSDHTVGSGAAAWAAAHGARVIEKHIALAEQPPSLDDGPHAARPVDFQRYVQLIRETERVGADLSVSLDDVFPPQPGRVVW